MAGTQSGAAGTPGLTDRARRGPGTETVAPPFGAGAPAGWWCDSPAVAGQLVSDSPSSLLPGLQRLVAREVGAGRGLLAGERARAFRARHGPRGPCRSHWCWRPGLTLGQLGHRVRAGLLLGWWNSSPLPEAEAEGGPEDQIGPHGPPSWRVEAGPWPVPLASQISWPEAETQAGWRLACMGGQQLRASWHQTPCVGLPEAEEEGWLGWTGAGQQPGCSCSGKATRGGGYLSVLVGRGYVESAHRLLLWALDGPLPLGERGRPLEATHTCNRKWCINPGHLVWVSGAGGLEGVVLLVVLQEEGGRGAEGRKGQLRSDQHARDRDRDRNRGGGMGRGRGHAPAAPAAAQGLPQRPRATAARRPGHAAAASPHLTVACPKVSRPNNPPPPPPRCCPPPLG
jgi:hypothetical protein